VLALAAPWAAAHPGKPHFTVNGWSMADGLPHPLVHAVAQDRDGFLWAGTWEGVVRFNGRAFTLFDRQNTPNAELAGVFRIVPEADGGVLFGTASNGIFRYYQGRWQRLGGAAARKLAVMAMLRDRRDGALWIASDRRLFRLDGTGRLGEAGAGSGLPAAEINDLEQDDAGDLLVASEAGAFRFAQGRAERWGGDWLRAGAVRALLRDGSGGWLVAGDDGVSWRHADGRVEHIVPGQRVDAVARDAHGALWMNMNTGVLLRRDPDGSLWPAPVQGAVSRALLVDREGLVWAGSTDGLYRVADGIASGMTRKDGLSSDYTRAVLQDDDGTVWVGDNNGLNRWAQGRVRHMRLGPAGAGRDTSVLALAWRDGALWVGTYDLGVFRLDRQGRVLERIRLGEGAQPLVRVVLPDADGGVWIGGSHGLALRRGGRTRHYLGGEGGQPATTVQALYRDPDGTLWIGSNDGMASLDAAGRLRRWRPDAGLPAQYAFDFLRDPDGDLWIASDRGLLRMRGGRFRVYDHRVGLPRDRLFRIIDDGAGNLWLSSNVGVFRVARAELDEIDAGKRSLLAVHVVDHSDGMPGNQCNGATMPAGWRMRDGTLLFPTSAGLAMIDPAGTGEAADRPKAPPVAFESIAVDGAQQPLEPNLRLEPGANRLAIGYAGMSFRAQGKLRYRYRLHGFDQDWVDAGGSTDAVYTRLPPGRYRLEVQAMAMPLDWTRRAGIGASSMWIDVVPALWQRPGMRALGAGLLLVGVVLVGWLRTASYRRNQRRLSRVIAERTEELSEKNRQLEVASSRLEYQASHDELTGLPNRRAGDRHLDAAVARAHARGGRLSVALLDIDHFKQINDRHGHAAGDAALQAFGGMLGGFAAGQGLFAARFGGEEFLVCMEGLPLEEAAQRMRELLLRIAGHEIALGNGVPVRCTFSAGVAGLEPGQAAHALLAQADLRLLRAKQGGRRCVVSD
jgi:diguanylate cyclase (GGDEF)-like protein